MSWLTCQFFPVGYARRDFWVALRRFWAGRMRPMSYIDRRSNCPRESATAPRLALTRLELAELLLDHYPHDRAEALEHLDFAIGELRDMKMQPAPERALSRREILEA